MASAFGRLWPSDLCHFEALSDGRSHNGWRVRNRAITANKGLKWTRVLWLIEILKDG